MTVTITARTFPSLVANYDGTFSTVYPDGDKPVGGQTLQWDLTGFAAVTNIQLGNPITRQVRQHLSGTSQTIVDAATITVEVVTGSIGNWLLSDPNLTNNCTALGSGIIRLKAAHASVANPAYSTNIDWSIIPQTPVNPADYDYSAATDGLANGAVGGSNWITFGGTGWALNANPATDGYLQITAGTSPWGGLSSNSLTAPLFQTNSQFTVVITVAAGSTWPTGYVSLNQGPYTQFTTTAGVKTLTVTSGVGSNSLVLTPNGTSSNGQVLRVTSLSATSVQDIFNYSQAAYSCTETDDAMTFGVTRTAPSSSAATVTCVINSGNSLASIVNTPVLNWSGNEGGQKLAILDPVDDGTVVLGLSSPSVGQIGTTQPTATVTINPVASGERPFPRIASMWLSNRSDAPDFDGADSGINCWHSAGGINIMKRFDVNIIQGYPELQAARGISFQQLATNVQAASTRNPEVYVYEDTEAVFPVELPGYWQPRNTAVVNNNWKLYTNGSSGTPLTSYYSGVGYAVNTTAASPPDTVTGQRWPQWFADYSGGWIHGGLYSNTLAPAISGPYWDNQLVQPRHYADWDRDGSTDDQATIASYYRSGFAALVAQHRQTYPSKKIIGNLADWMNGNTSIQANYPEFYRIYDGAFLEHLWAWNDNTQAGASFSAVHFLSTSQLVAAIQRAEDAILQPYLLLLGGYPSDGSGTNYQEFRHGLCGTLVASNGSFCWSRTVTYQITDIQYEEYAFNLGAPSSGAAGTRQTAATSNGIWRRDFANGIVLWCPKGVTGTISLGGTFYRLQGNAAGGGTPGAQVTSITFSSAQNGLILSRTPT